MKYRVVVGINYRPDPKDPEKRAEPGDIVPDLAPKTAVWMLEQGIIEPEDVVEKVED